MKANIDRSPPRAAVHHHVGVDAALSDEAELAACIAVGLNGRCQGGEILEAAAVDRQIANRLLSDHLAMRRIGDLEQLRCDLDALHCRRKRDRQVHGHGAADCHDYILHGCRRETGRFDLHFIGGGIERADAVLAGLVRGGLPLQSCPRARNSHFRVRNHSLVRIDDCAVDAALIGVGLTPGNGRENEKSE